jgi:hypothetical protein
MMPLRQRHDERSETTIGQTWPARTHAALARQLHSRYLNDPHPLQIKAASVEQAPEQERHHHHHHHAMHVSPAAG